MTSSYFENKSVVITGASSGLGKELAQEFLNAGSKLYICARNEERLQESAIDIILKKESKHTENYLKKVVLDIGNKKSIDSLAEQVMKETGKIDIWINNAGGETKGNIFELSEEQLQTITATNYFGLVYGTQAAACIMKEKKAGDIVQILSTSCFTPREDELAYGAAKAAAENFSKSAGLTLRKYGIRIINVYPGGMDTNFAKSAGLSAPPNLMNPKEIAQEICHALTLSRNIVPELRFYRA